MNIKWLWIPFLKCAVPFPPHLPLTQHRHKVWNSVMAAWDEILRQWSPHSRHLRNPAADVNAEIQRCTGPALHSWNGLAKQQAEGRRETAAQVWGVCLCSTRILVHTSSWVTFRGTVLNIKIIANLPTVLQQAEAIKLRLIFLPATTFFLLLFLLCPLQSCLQVQLGNDIMSGLRIYCGICFLPQEDFYISLQYCFHGRHSLDSLWLRGGRGLYEPLAWLLLFFCLFL